MTSASTSPAPTGQPRAEAGDPAASARAAGLRYVTDAQPGIQRRRAGAGFRYVAPDGTPLRDPEALARIKALAIPPAWTEVWICSNPHGHIQATGLDARGRKQYRYHPRWREVRDAQKYDRLLAFGEALPRIRQRVDEHLQLSGLPREKVLATVVRLLEATSVRIGNDEYVRQNRSYGLTTLRSRHARLEGGSAVRFEFNGKSGKRHSVRVADRRLARIIRRCQELPGQELFQYLDEEGGRRSVESDDVNAYLREVSGGDFTAKDFRTWNGTVEAARFLCACEPCATEREGKQRVVEAIKVVASQLGNTPAVCRKAYVHPAVLDAYLGGSLAPRARNAPRGPYDLSADEQCVLTLLRELSAASTAPATQAA